jgi:hypothetical protein
MIQKGLEAFDFIDLASKYLQMSTNIHIKLMILHLNYVDKIFATFINIFQKFNKMFNIFIEIVNIKKNQINQKLLLQNIVVPRYKFWL